jgi:hypothetical protein
MSRMVPCAVAWFREWILCNGIFAVGLLIPLAIVYGPAFKALIHFATYYLASFPIGYRALYTIGAVLWDPAAISKVLTYILLAVTAIAVAAAARRLAGYFGAFLAPELVCPTASSFLYWWAVCRVPSDFVYQSPQRRQTSKHSVHE